MTPEEITRRLLEDAFNVSFSPEPEPEPEPKPTITIGQIFSVLPEQTVNQIMTTLNRETDTIRMSRKLKELLRPHAAALEKLGLLPDYTAYMLTAVAQQHRDL